MKDYEEVIGLIVPPFGLNRSIGLNHSVGFFYKTNFNRSLDLRKSKNFGEGGLKTIKKIYGVKRQAFLKN